MAQPTYQNLLDENQRLREETRHLRQENRQLRMRVDALETQVLKLTALLEQAQRTGKRQAAPFSKGPPNGNPKPPGRKGGENFAPCPNRNRIKSSTSPCPSSAPTVAALPKRITSTTISK